eukprot:9665473-Alexandrium_andersonii.AAC.1
MEAASATAGAAPSSRQQQRPQLKLFGHESARVTWWHARRPVCVCDSTLHVGCSSEEVASTRRLPLGMPLP